MNRLVVALISSSFAVGCSSSDDGKVDPLAPPPPAILSVSPSLAFRGRPATLDVATTGTSFVTAPRVTVGGDKATIDGVTVLSSGALRVRLFVPATTTDEDLTVTVDGLTLEHGLRLGDPIELQSKRLAAKQGLGGTIRLLDKDHDHPFLDGSVTIDLGPGVKALPVEVTAFEATFELRVAPDAAPGERDAKVRVGTIGDRALETTLAKVLRVDALSVTDLPEKTPATLDVPTGVEGAYFRAKSPAGRLLSFRCTRAVDGKGVAIRPLLSMFGAGGAVPGGTLAGDELLVPAGSLDPLLFAGPNDWSAITGASMTLVLDGYDAVAGAEIEPNEATTQATPLTLPALAKGVLSSIDDVDVYSFTAPKGTLVVRTLPAADDPYAPDTLVELLDATGKVFAYSEDEDAAANDGLSFVRATIPATSVVYVRVKAGAAALGGGAYRLAVVTR